MPQIYVSPHDILSELSRTELVELVFDAGIEGDVVARLRKEGGEGNGLDMTAREYARSAQEDLLCNRVERARTAIEKAISTYVPAELISAFKELDDGNIGRAICDLEKAAFPHLTPPMKAA